MIWKVKGSLDEGERGVALWTYEGQLFSDTVRKQNGRLEYFTEDEDEDWTTFSLHKRDGTLHKGVADLIYILREDL